jgi:hypothetical protein
MFSKCSLIQRVGMSNAAECAKHAAHFVSLTVSNPDAVPDQTPLKVQGSAILFIALTTTSIFRIRNI